MPRLLLIDDDEHLAAPLAAYLRRRHLARPGVVAANAVSPLLAAVDGSLSDAAVLDRAAALARADITTSWAP